MLSIDSLVVGGVDDGGADHMGGGDHSLDEGSGWQDERSRGSHHSLDQRSSGDHKGSWGSHHGLDQRSGGDDGLDQRSCGDHGVNHGSSGDHGVNHRGGVSQGNLADQVDVALVGDGRGGTGVHVSGLGQNRGLDDGVGLGNQTRGSGGHGQASEEGNLWIEKGCSVKGHSIGKVSPWLALTNLNIFGVRCLGFAVIGESIATVDDDRAKSGLL